MSISLSAVNPYFLDALRSSIGFQGWLKRQSPKAGKCLLTEIGRFSFFIYERTINDYSRKAPEDESHAYQKATAKM
jgi:hypothetical protein